MAFLRYLIHAMRKEGLFFWTMVFAFIIVLSMKFPPFVISLIIILFRLYQNFLTTRIADELGLFARFVVPLLVIFSPGGLLLFLKHLEKKDQINYPPEMLVIFLAWIVFRKIYPYRGGLLGRYGGYFDLKSQERMEDYYYEKRQEEKYRNR